MRTVEKALRLLDFFDDQHPEHGLSNLARMAGIDKATVLRMLSDMAAAGLTEQDPQSKRWRLGAGILRLARLREAAFPVTRVLSPILVSLSERTGETAHASLLAGRELGTIGVAESTRSNRVSIEPAQVLPLHATASGLAFLAFARPDQQVRSLAQTLSPETAHTPITRDALETHLARTRRQGYAVADQTYEVEVYGIAMPLFGPDGFSVGALAVATPSSRVTAPHVAAIVEALSHAASEATVGLGGTIPPHHHIAA